MAKKFNYNFVKKYIEENGYKLISEEYFNIHKKIKIQCPKNHIFEMSFNNFKKGQRCPICGRENQNRIPNKPNNKKHSQEYIKQLVEERGYKLLEPYINKRTKLKLECPNGHYHEIRLDSFQNGSGCKQCMINKMTNNLDDVKNNLLKKGFKLLSKYHGSHEKATFQCCKGHIFESSYDHLINGKAKCPICLGSSGEQRIAKYLSSCNINFIPQYRFEDCRCHNQLPFDFYIPHLNVAIEFDGELHYKIIKHFGGLDAFIDRKIRDTIKNYYCEKNNIKLIRIPYWEFDNIEKILDDELNKYE